MNHDLTQGGIAKTLLRFACSMILGNLLQQVYNIADTLIVGQYIGKEALAAVGASYTLMVFLTSILIGLCMGSGILFSMFFGRREIDHLKNSAFVSFLFIGAVTIVITIAAFVLLDPIMGLLNIPKDIYAMTRSYLYVIFFGIGFTFLYNYFASFMRGIGNSFIPLVFLAVAVLLNIVLDLFFIIQVDLGVAGAALATVIAQGVSALGLFLYCIFKVPFIRIKKEHMHVDRDMLGQISRLSLLTCIQQSVMNFGILMVQGLINSFGLIAMAAYAAAVKIDSFAYMPVQDFGNAFSTFIAQNYGAGKNDRIRKGITISVKISLVFCLIISAFVIVFAKPLMLLFIKPEETAVIQEGIRYLRIEGSFYAGIGCLFLLYGLYRGLGRPGISIVLTVISLGTRVALAYALAAIPSIGLTGIWIAVPIGWILADLVGFLYYKGRMKGVLESPPENITIKQQ